MAIKKTNVFALGDRIDVLRMQEQGVILVHVAEDKDQVCVSREDGCMERERETSSETNTTETEISIRTNLSKFQPDSD